MLNGRKPNVSHHSWGGGGKKKKKAFKIKKRLYFNLQTQTKCTNTPGLEGVGEQAE